MKRSKGNMSKDLGITKEYLMILIAKEKEEFARHETSCRIYSVPVNPTATAVARARIQLLEDLMHKKLEKDDQ